MKVTNNSKALQGVHSATGVIYLLPGETKDVDLTAAGHKGASRLSFLKVEGKAPAEGGDEKEELIAKLKALGIDAAGNSRVDTLRKKLEEAEAAKVAADAEDTQKQAVIAELKGLNAEFDEEASLADLQAVLTTAKA